MIILSSMLCHQNCSYCFFKTNDNIYSKNFKKIFIDNKELLNRISYIIYKIYEKNDFITLRFFGAETFLNPYIGDAIENIVKRIRIRTNKPIKLFVNTNLSFTNNLNNHNNFQKILKIIKKYNLEFFLITTLYWYNQKEVFMKDRKLNKELYGNIINNINILSLNKNIKLINNYILSKKLLENQDLIKNDLREIKDIMNKSNNFQYFNILPVAFSENNIVKDNNKEIFIKKLLSENNKIIKVEDYFVSKYILEINSKYPVPLYPFDMIIDGNWYLTFNLINYENFALYNFTKIKIDNINNEEIDKILNNKEKLYSIIEKDYKQIINKLKNTFPDTYDQTLKLYNI